jgi:NAD-dependent DNA ligase
VLRLIQMIRDETHRAAVTYHRKRREMRDFTSELTAIPGVGDKRRTRLLRNFGSIARIARASAAELAPFVGRQTAAEIATHFTRQRALAGMDDGAQAADAADVPLDVETRLDDPAGAAEDLQPLRSVDHKGEVLRRRKSTRKRGERSTNPHGVRREKLAEEDKAELPEA